MRFADLQRPQSAVRASRWLAGALIIALLAHAGLLILWLSALVRRPEATLLPLRELVPALMAGGAIAAMAILVFPRRVSRVLAVAVLATACALLGPGVVASVSLMTLSAHVVGSAGLGWVAKGIARDEPVALPGAPICVLVGTCLWLGLIGATIAWPVHYAPVYVLCLAASLLGFPQRTRAVVAAIGQWSSANHAWSGAERAWIVLAAMIAVMHVIVVAKPEVGYDASTMHLQFAQLVSQHHRWDFDVGRYAWAVMPMGADYAYLSAYLLDGERAARLVDLLFGALLCAIVYDVIRRQASREVALGSVCLLASSPLWFLESATLYVEFAWTAFLVAGLASALVLVKRRDPVHAAAALICLAGAMQCKVIGVFWAAPLAVALLCFVARERRSVRARLASVCALALVLGAWPYVNAWLRTGNPVFPFMNTLFRSPLFESATPFNNAAFNAPLTLFTPYDLVMATGRYIEGSDGAAGTQWLLLFPVVAFGLVTRRIRIRWALFALALGFAVIVYLQQSYLRYLIPALVVMTILGGWALGDWIRSARASAAFATVGACLTLANVWLMPAGMWSNATLCLPCAFDDGKRNAYIERYAPLRTVADYLNRNLAHARVGFLIFNAPAPSGYVGYSRSANWHDTQAFAAFAAATTVDDVTAVVRRFRLTHAVFVDRPEGSLDRALLEFRDRRTTPVAHIGNYIIAAIRQDAP